MKENLNEKNFLIDYPVDISKVVFLKFVIGIISSMFFTTVLILIIIDFEARFTLTSSVNKYNLFHSSTCY